uniref:Uncharacterized protein n=1 Tax=Mesocestoides corti TaxID=53468 RepID=A0A5K3FM38_MESCO
MWRVTSDCQLRGRRLFGCGSPRRRCPDDASTVKDKLQWQSTSTTPVHVCHPWNQLRFQEFKHPTLRVHFVFVWARSESRPQSADDGGGGGGGGGGVGRRPYGADDLGCRQSGSHIWLLSHVRVHVCEVVACANTHTHTGTVFLSGRKFRALKTSVRTSSWRGMKTQWLKISRPTIRWTGLMDCWRCHGNEKYLF